MFSSLRSGPEVGIPEEALTLKAVKSCNLTSDTGYVTQEGTPAWRQT